MALSPMGELPFGVRERIWLARVSGMDRLYVRNGIAAFSQELISVWRALQQESAFGCGVEAVEGAAGWPGRRGPATFNNGLPLLKFHGVSLNKP